MQTKRAAKVAGVLMVVATMAVGRVAAADDTEACINASESALSLESAEKLIEARATLATCASPNCSEPIRPACQQRLADVQKAIPTILFLAKDGSGRDLAEVTVAVDNSPRARLLDGRPLEVNPGPHDFRFEVTGQTAVVKRLVLRQGEKDRREDITIGAASPVAPPPQVAPAPAAPLALVPGLADVPADPTKRGTGQRTIGLVLGGVGVAGLVVGGLSAALYEGALSTYHSNCGPIVHASLATQCLPAGVSAAKEASTRGTIAATALIGGGIAAVAGATLFLTAPKGAGITQVGIGPGSAWIIGQY